MTQEEKQLLLKDLCARMSYGLKLKHCQGPTCRLRYLNLDTYNVYVEVLDSDYFKDFIEDGKRHITEFTPYLRPMSSITREELKELNDKYGSIAYFFIQEPPYYYGLQAQHSDIGSIEISEFSEIYDWLNVHHFDYRGLIEKGLALEAPEDMYKPEKEPIDGVLYAAACGIKNATRKSEKPMNQDELEKEIEKFLNKTGAPYVWCNDDEQKEWCSIIARHFAQWGAENLKK